MYGQQRPGLAHFPALHVTVGQRWSQALRGVLAFIYGPTLNGLNFWGQDFFAHKEQLVFIVFNNEVREGIRITKTQLGNKS